MTAGKQGEILFSKHGACSVQTEKKLMAASKTIHQVVERDLMEDIVISE